MIPLPAILTAVCAVCHCTEEDVKSPNRRTRNIVDAKHAFAYLARLQRHSGSEIGAFLGLSVNTVNVRIQCGIDRNEFDPKFHRVIEQVWNELKATTRN